MTAIGCFFDCKRGFVQMGLRKTQPESINSCFAGNALPGSPGGWPAGSPKLGLAKGSLLGLLVLAGLVWTGTTLAQTQSVKMNFNDQTILTDPFADSNAVLVSGTSAVQESDFVPRVGIPQTDNLTNTAERSRSQIDSAIEILQVDEEKERNDPIEKLGSDDPVQPPTFNLSGESSDKTAPQKEEQNRASSSVQQTLSDGYQLPTVADVRAPISFAPMANTSQNDPSNLLINDQTANFQQRFVPPTSNYAEISGMPAEAKFKTWRAHNVYHRPTYFEDQNLELNGNQRTFQNVASAVSFFSTIPRLPYLIGQTHPQERIYTFGDDRPGDAAPLRIFKPTRSRKGRALQTIASLGLILP